MVMVTSKTIADMAGVSRGTVDRVLNNRGDVSEATKQKILTIVKLLDYKPNKAGQILVNQQKNIKIGCIIIDAANPFYDELLRGINQKVEEYLSWGIEVVVKRVTFESKVQCECIDELLKMGISGLVIQPVNEAPLAQKLRQLSGAGIPVVTTNTTVDGAVPLCHVGNDFFTYGKTAANLLEMLTQGNCRIGIITGFHNAQSHSDRIKGFQEYIRDLPRMKIAFIEENLDNDAESFRVTQKTLRKYRDVNALFLVAGGVDGACRALKTFPGYHRVKVVCFDDLPATKAHIRDGTIQAAICQQPVIQGKMSLDVLFQYLIDKKEPPERHFWTNIQIKVKANLDV
jgi:LacI family transcriptional regulator